MIMDSESEKLMKQLERNCCPKCNKNAMFDVDELGGGKRKVNCKTCKASYMITTVVTRTVTICS